MTKKIYALLIFFSFVMASFSILLYFTARQHDEKLDAFLSDYAETDRYRNLTITDRNGAVIYSGSFDDSETVRRATFHVVGDQFGSVPSSVLSIEANKETTVSMLSGYQTVSSEVKLNIDLRLQVGAYTLLEGGNYRGAVVVLNHKTGEIITLVSTPSVDVLEPNNCKEGAFLCKATSAYTPGSVMKTVSVACAMEKDAITANAFQYTCSGENGHICCYDYTAHGEERLSDMLSNSCNCGIAALVNAMILPNDLDDYVSQSHFLDGDIVRDYQTADGNLDVSDDVWWSACGQSKDLATPIGMGAYYAAVANKGTLITPCLYSDTIPQSYLIMSEQTAESLSSALAPVAERAGVGCKAFAKSGTAQLGEGEPHSWFICSLVDDNAPPYTIVVFVEHGGNSSPARSLLVSLVDHYILEEDAE